MKASFDGARINLVTSFNDFCLDETLEKLDEQERESLNDLRTAVIGLLCMYNDSDEDDCNDLCEKYFAKSVLLEESEE